MFTAVVFAERAQGAIIEGDLSNGTFNPDPEVSHLLLLVRNETASIVSVILRFRRLFIALAVSPWDAHWRLLSGRFPSGVA